MKNITFIILFGFQYTGFSTPLLLKSLPAYHIVSDLTCDDVPPNKCRVRGTVTNSGWPVSNGKIATFPITVSTFTNQDGHYGLMLTESDSVLYFFSNTQGEIVIYPYDFKGGHEVVIDFYTENTWLYPEEDKPVIYIYSKKAIDVEVELSVRGEMTFSYPTYDNAWKVNVNKNGIYHKDSEANYPYLFWEGKDKYLDFVYEGDEMSGLILKTDTILPFLIEKLTYLGLNEREKTDFITYWVPRIIPNNYIVLQFLIDDDYDRFIAGIRVSPPPDAMLRLFMLYKGYDERPICIVKPQQLDSFVRFGFSVVEWGGSQLK